jgi:CheY-like chemotaxis protein
MADGIIPRVLLADCSPRMRRILRVNLEGGGCQVAETDGPGLQAGVGQADIDALVINLDVRNDEVCDAVNRFRRRIPGAVVAGYSILPPDEAVRRLCVDLYVEKPFDITAFVARLRGACARARRPSEPSSPNLDY